MSTARRRKKALALECWVLLCRMPDPQWSGPVRCLHYSGQECRAQARHERRVLGAAGLWSLRHDEVRNLILWNQPPSLWMGNGDRHHRRYRNRSTR